MKQYQPMDGKPFPQRLEEVWPSCIPTFQLFISSQQREVNPASVGRFLSKYKEKHKLDDWKTPRTVEYVEINRMVPLGENKWTRSVEWSWKKQMQR
jgi:hypothetical protein